MKTIVFDSPGNIRLIDTPPPKDPAADEALVKVHRVGICGTDYAGFLGKMPYFSYPRIPGHELGVEVVALGGPSSSLQLGDRCSVEPYLNCRRCYSCRRGLTNCCESHRTLGVMCDGGLTEYICLPMRKLHPALQLSYDQMALVETLAIGCHAVNRAQVRKGENVLVIGAGPIGLSVIEFCRLAQARLIVMDMLEDRLRFVQNHMDVDETILFRGSNIDEVVKELAGRTEEQLADVVFDATGNSESMSGALAYVAYGGRLVYVGIAQQEIHFYQAPHLHRKELSILASRNALPEDFQRIIRLIEQGEIDTRPWMTHHIDIDDLAQEFARLARPDSGVVKAIVEVVP